MTPLTFTKRELSQQERGLDLYGSPIKTCFTRERLLNEHAALQFIRTWTSIPVPRVLDFTEKEGLLALTLERVNGVMLEDLQGIQYARALENIDSYIRNQAIPQLHRLRSSRLGSLIREVVPPERVKAIDKRPVWPRRYANLSEDFVYCHNDLAQHNIFVDAETLQVISIIDWEYSGFFPRETELHIWLKPFAEMRECVAADAAHTREVLLRPGNIFESCPCLPFNGY